jgi:Gluconate 2-dehydrogenase subunit 3
MSQSEQQSSGGRAAVVSRRSALKVLGATAGAVATWPYLSDEAAEAFALLQRTKAAPKLVFLTPAQYATVEAFSEVIIPADDHSPGAKAARVADYIDLLLGESGPETRKSWTDGLAALDQTSQERHQSPFVKLTPEQQVALVTEISRNESKPSSPIEEFFNTTKQATVRGYYTSEIGIHKELEYKGNQFLGEFVGCTHPEHGYQAPSGE